MIQIENVWKRMGEEEVLRGVDLEVREGELMVIIGGSGMGKSVLLKHIIGFLKPDSGDILVDGVSIPNASRKKLYEIRQHYGVVFQSPALLQSLTIEENIAIPLQEESGYPPDRIREIVSERLHWVKLYDVEGKLPSELSGGMQKRASLARALVMDPSLILFDEPATGLDPILTATIGQLIVDLHGRIGFTSIAVTHNMSFAYMIGDRIAMLYNGRIIAIGTPEEIRRNSEPLVQEFIHGIPEEEEGGERMTKSE